MSLTLEQMKLRQTGVSGSELAGLLGLDPHKKPIDIFLAKVTEAAVSSSAGWRAEVGTILEPRVMQWYADTTGRTVTQPGTLVHPQEPLVIATPDGISHGPGTPDVVIEVKCPGNRRSWHWGEPGTDEVPDYYYPQVQWELAVTGLEMAHVAVDRGGFVPDIYMVPFDRDLYEAMLESVKEFWQDHVIPRIPPEPDGSNSYEEFIKTQLSRKRVSKLREPTPEIDRIAMQAFAMRDRADASDKDMEVLKQKLKVFIGDHDGVQGSWGTITWRNTGETQKTDWKAVAKACNPSRELINEHTKTHPGIRRMLFSTPKEGR